MEGFNSSTLLGGETFAHEIGHTILGSKNAGDWYDPRDWIPAHVQDECGAHGPFFEGYPNHGSEMALIDEYGFDGTTVYDRDQYYDFMSYAPCPNSGVYGLGRWVSTYIYKMLYNEFKTSSGKAESEVALTEGGSRHYS